MKKYKDIYYKYMTLSLVGALSIGIFIGNAGKYQLYLVAGLVVWLLGNALFWQYMANNRTKTFRKLYDDCNIKEYVKLYRELDSRTPRFSDDLSKNDIKINLASGLYALGNYDEAIKVLDEAHLRDRTSHQDMVQDISLNSNMALCLIEKGDLDGAEKRLNRCYCLMDSVKLKEPFRSHAIQICDSTMEYLNMKEGNLEGMEEKFRAWSENSSDPVSAISAKYRLAEICWAKGKNDEAMELFRQVAESGGDTIYAVKAREIANRKGKQTIKISIPMQE